MLIHKKDIKRFWDKVNIKTKDECWEWQAYLLKGYGQFHLNGYTELAHRISFMSCNEMKDKNNLSVDYGVIVKAGTNQNELAVIPGGPADKAGIVENDIILEIDGVKLDEKANLASIIREKRIGQVVNLKILHRGSEKNVPVTLEAAKDN